MAGLASGIISIAICDRCKMKLPYQELRADGNSPGLRVCRECRDDRDPYRLPARQPDPLALRFARPDRELVEGAVNYLETTDGFFITTDDLEYIEV